MGHQIQAPNLRENRGSAIIITLAIAIVLAAVVEIGVSSYFQLRSQILDSRISGTYASLSELVTSKSVTFSKNGSLIPLADTLRTSLSQTGTNQQLANCIIGSSVASCQDGVAQPLTIYFPILQAANQPRMAGPGPAGAAGSSPARYDLYGNPCDSTTWTKSCPFEVYAQFTPVCGAPGVCNRATSISIHFQMRGPHGGSFLVSGDEHNLPVSDILSGSINVNAILPPTPAQVAQDSSSNVQIQEFSGTTTTTAGLDWSKVNPVIIAGLTNPDGTLPIDANTTEVIDALNSSGVTDPTILKALAHAWVNEAGDARAIADAITAAGITDTNVIAVLAQGWIQDPTQDAQVASELAASGIAYDNPLAQITLGSLIHNGITDPATLAAMYNALAAQDGLGWDYAARLVAQAGATTPAQVLDIINQIKGEPSGDGGTGPSSITSNGGGSSEHSGSSTPGGPAVLPPPTFTMLNTCSGAQCLNPSF